MPCDLLREATCQPPAGLPEAGSRPPHLGVRGPWGRSEGPRDFLQDAFPSLRPRPSVSSPPKGAGGRPPRPPFLGAQGARSSPGRSFSPVPSPGLWRGVTHWRSGPACQGSHLLRGFGATALSLSAVPRVHQDSEQGQSWSTAGRGGATGGRATGRQGYGKAGYWRVGLWGRGGAPGGGRAIGGRGYWRAGLLEGSREGRGYWREGLS
uniref:Uncharacterized protein n=1 Tax=Pipistrellus kuhlii TaxID=59472 RepID=A0A7J7V5U0_PIPKU|nr:hypothetical protein mPipKuh1_008552 [Pipistrellus kuhlii]